MIQPPPKKQQQQTFGDLKTKYCYVTWSFIISGGGGMILRRENVSLSGVRGLSSHNAANYVIRIRDAHTEHYGRKSTLP